MSRRGLNAMRRLFNEPFKGKTIHYPFNKKMAAGEMKQLIAEVR